MFELNFVSSKDIKDFDGKDVQVNIIVDEDSKYGTSLKQKSIMDIENIYANSHAHFCINSIYDDLTTALNKLSKSEELGEEDWKTLAKVLKGIHDTDISVFVDVLLFARLNMEVTDINNKKEMIREFADMVMLETSAEPNEGTSVPDTDGANAVTYVNGAPVENDEEYEDPDQVHMGYQDDDGVVPYFDNTDDDMCGA